MSSPAPAPHPKKEMINDQAKNHRDRARPGRRFPNVRAARHESPDTHFSFRILDWPIKHGFRYFFQLPNLHRLLIVRKIDFEEI